MTTFPAHVNFLAILAAAVINFILGWLWFGPVFGKTWVKLGGGELKPGPLNVIVGFITSLIIAIVLDLTVIVAFRALQNAGIGIGLAAGFAGWFGFIAPVTVGPVIYERKSLKLWLMNNAYWLVSLLIMGAILAAWG
jgi:hypothetical protein